MATEKVFKKRVSGFPRVPFLLSVVAAGALYLLGGLSGWGSLLFGIVQFSLTGGFQFFKLFYKTVPRDIRCASRVHIMSYTIK